MELIAVNKTIDESIFFLPPKLESRDLITRSHRLQ